MTTWIETIFAGLMERLGALGIREHSTSTTPPGKQNINPVWFHGVNSMKNIINQENVIFCLDLRISESRLQSTKTIMIKIHHEISIS